MNTIDENLINYIEDGDPQNSTVLNRPVKELVQQLELFEFPSEIVQVSGNSETKVMSQKQVTEQLTGWGSENCELPPDGWETSKNGIYWVDQSLHSEVGTPTPSSSEDGVLMVVGKANPQGSDNGEVNQLLFQNGTLKFRTSDEQDLSGNNVWSHWKTFINLEDQQTITGLKTFNEFPKTPEMDPVSDYQVQNKKYVDAAVSHTNILNPYLNGGWKDQSIGFEIKWGFYVGDTNNDVLISFTQPFENDCVNVQITRSSTSNDVTNSFQATGLSKNGFTKKGSSESGKRMFYWLAMGH